MIIEESSSSLEEFDPSIFSKEELRDLINDFYCAQMPDWEFYLAINGLSFFLRTTVSIHNKLDCIMDTVCTYYKKDSYQNGLYELELYNKLKKHLRSSKWERICDLVLERDHHTCTRCGSNDNINCYHIHYSAEVLFNESQHLDKLTSLCRKCYKETHFPIKGNNSYN